MELLHALILINFLASCWNVSDYLLHRTAGMSAQPMGSGSVSGDISPCTQKNMLDTYLEKLHQQMASAQKDVHDDLEQNVEFNRISY